MTRYHFITGQWQQALRASKAQRNSAGKNEFYRLLREYLILRKLGELEEAKEFFADETSQIKLLDWEAQLTKYHLGELDQQGLLSKSDDLCKKTEAYFYIGFDYWLKGDIVHARNYFSKTLAHGHPAYLEYLAAKNLMPLLNGIVAYSSHD